MTNYLLKRELAEVEIPITEGKGLIYSVQVRYGSYNPHLEDIDFDPKNSACYQNFIDLSSVERFLKIMQTRKSPFQKFPLVELAVRVQSIPLAEYPRVQSSTLNPIAEKKVVDGKTLEDKIYEYPPGQFIRNPRFCDIIKGYDYDAF